MHNPQPNTRGIGPLVGRTSGNCRSVMHVLAVIFSITYIFSFICQYILIWLISFGRKICPLLMHPSKFLTFKINNENMSSGKGLTPVKTTLLPGQNGVICQPIQAVTSRRTFLYRRRGRCMVVLPQRNFGRICAELWTKNSAYRTVPILDFWVLEWY